MSFKHQNAKVYLREVMDIFVNAKFFHRRLFFTQV